MFISAITGALRNGPVKRIGLQRFVERRRHRRALARLTPRQLSDIGVSPEEAAYDFARPFSDVPAHWRS